MAITRVHLTILFDESEVPTVASSRRRWDPAMAHVVPPHVTLVYPEEFDDERLLVQRATAAAATFGSFSLTTSELLIGDDRGAGGVFVSVLDPTGSWSALRRVLLQPPFRARDVAPHFTLVHPRTSRLGPEAATALLGTTFSGRAHVKEFCLTSTDATSMTIRHRFRLTGDLE